MERKREAKRSIRTHVLIKQSGGEIIAVSEREAAFVGGSLKGLASLERLFLEETKHLKDAITYKTPLSGH